MDYLVYNGHAKNIIFQLIIKLNYQKLSSINGILFGYFSKTLFFNIAISGSNFDIWTEKSYIFLPQ